MGERGVREGGDSELLRDLAESFRLNETGRYRDVAATNSERSFNESITRGRRVGATAAQRRLRRVLVAAEVALAVVLLAGAGLLLQSFARLVNVDLGFAREHTVALQVFLDEQTETGARMNFFRETLERIRTLPGVAAAGAVSSFPLGLAHLTIETPLTIHDRAAAAARRRALQGGLRGDPGLLGSDAAPAQERPLVRRS